MTSSCRRALFAATRHFDQEMRSTMRASSGSRTASSVTWYLVLRARDHGFLSHASALSRDASGRSSSPGHPLRRRRVRRFLGLDPAGVGGAAPIVAVVGGVVRRSAERCFGCRSRSPARITGVGRQGVDVCDLNRQFRGLALLIIHLSVMSFSPGSRCRRRYRSARRGPHLIRSWKRGGTHVEARARESNSERPDLGRAGGVAKIHQRVAGARPKAATTSPTRRGSGFGDSPPPPPSCRAGECRALRSGGESRAWSRRRD